MTSDYELLEKAYLSIAKKIPSVPSDEPTSLPSTEPNEIVSSGPVDEPAPGVDMDMLSSPEPEIGGLEEPSLESPSIGGDPRLEVEDEDQEDDISISNLNSIRESIMKIASHCASGNHLEPWQQQKLSIAMDNLADVARRIK
jgi:hypothetical protein